MTPQTEDQPRLYLEHGLAAISAAEDYLKVASMRITYRMRTEEERHDLNYINAARAAMRRAIENLSQLHPNHRSEEKGAAMK